MPEDVTIRRKQQHTQIAGRCVTLLSGFSCHKPAKEYASVAMMIQRHMYPTQLTIDFSSAWLCYICGD